MKKIAFVGDPHISDKNPRARIDNYFEAIMNKMDYVMENNDIMISIGDLLHKPVLSTSFSIELAIRFRKYKDQGKEIYSLFGSHDYFNMQEDTLRKTTFGLLSYFGLIEIIDERIDIEGVHIDAIPFRNRPKITPYEGDKSSILIGHYFYNNSWDKLGSVTREQLEACKYTYMLLGHDHEPYKPLKVGNTTLLRPGALARHTLHEYNLSRDISYYQFVVDNGEIKSVDRKDIPIANSVDVFDKSDKSFVRNKSSTVSDIDVLFKDFKAKSRGKAEKYSIVQMLNEIKAPRSTVSYLKGVYVKNNIAFS